MADQFVRVRLTRIDNIDLNLFEFDYDLTFMVFFMDAEEKIYARYGGRDAKDPDNRQSLAGLLYTMKSVLQEHQAQEKSFASRDQEGRRFIRDVPGVRARGCLHCHQVKEALNENLKKTGQWSRDLVWRYPLPENLGMRLEVDRGNVVQEVKPQSPAAAAGLKPGDVLRRLGTVPIHSLGDAQFALDHAAKTGTLAVAWKRGDQAQEAQLTLTEGWRKSDISWRPSLQYLVPFVRLYGTDLTAEEKQGLGLPAKQLAFRQKESVPKQAHDAGIRGGDVILGVDDTFPETDVDGFLRHVQRSYVIGDQAVIQVLREGKRLKLTMTFVP